VDLPLYLRVLWRFRLLVALGTFVALLLALLVTVRVSSTAPHFSYRQGQTFSSEARVFVTQQGFPWGYADPPTATPGTPGAAAAAEAKLLGTTKQFADPTRFPSLAVLYAYLAMSDPVKRIMLRDGPVRGAVIASPVVSTQSGYGTTLPLVAISGTGPTPADAVTLTIRATNAFRRFLEEQQAGNRIPAQNRVLLTVITKADPPVLVKGRSKTLPMVVFVTVLLGVLGLVFMLENMKPRIRRVTADEVARLPKPEQQSA
jgi:hypothetical protein